MYILLFCYFIYIAYYITVAVKKSKLNILRKKNCQNHNLVTIKIKYSDEPLVTTWKNIDKNEFLFNRKSSSLSITASFVLPRPVI